MPILSVVAGEWSGNIEFKVKDPAEKSLEEQANEIFEQITFIAKRLIFNIDCEMIKSGQISRPFLYYVG